MHGSEEIIKHVSTLSYLGIFLVSFMANVFVPIPEEIIILAIGYVAGTGKISPFIAGPLVIIGALTSDFMMFELSRRGNKIIKVVHDKFFSKVIPLKDEFVNEHINKIIFFSRFMVQMRFFGPFLAGKIKTSYKTFLSYDLLALTVYVTFLMWTGHYFESRISRIFDGIGQFKNILFGVIGLVILILIFKYIRTKFVGYIKERNN